MDRLYVCIRLYRATENTNQRVFFDIEPCGRHLGTGGQVLLIFLSFLMPELMFFPYLEKLKAIFFPLLTHL